MADQGQQRSFASRKQGIDRSKAAKLFIDNYYQNLLKQRSERDERCEDLSITSKFVKNIQYQKKKERRRIKQN